MDRQQRGAATAITHIIKNIRTSDDELMPEICQVVCDLITKYDLVHSDEILREAARCVHCLPVLQFMVRGGAVADDHLMRAATAYNNLSTIRYIVGLGVNLPDDLVFDVIYNITHWRLELLIYLVECGMNTHAIDSAGQNILHRLQAPGHGTAGLELATYAVAQGVDVHHRDLSGRTPLDLVGNNGSMRRVLTAKK